jgi:hypothetical protein
LNRDRIQSLGANAAQGVRERHSIERMASRTAEIYESVSKGVVVA